MPYSDVKPPLRLRHIRDQVLWSSDGAAFTVNTSGSTVYVWNNDNTIEEAQYIPTDYNGFDYEEDNFLGPILNPGGRADVCIITYSGSVVSLTPDPSSVVTVNPIIVNGYGIPASGPSIYEQEAFEDLPYMEDGDDGTADKIGSLLAMPLCSTNTSILSGFPSFVQGRVPGADVGGSSPPSIYSFIFQQLSQATAGDKFHITLSVGKLERTAPTISGLERLYIRFLWTHGQDAPLLLTNMTLSGNIVASLYEAVA